MKKGNLSNVPAPYVYVDANSLYDKGFFKLSPRLQYVKKLVSIIRYANVAIFVEKGGRVSVSDIEKSPFAYTIIFKTSIKEVVKLIRQEKSVILVDGERAEEFSSYNVAVFIDNAAENILAEVHA